MYDMFEIWYKCTEKLKESINETIFNIWIKPIVPIEANDTSFKVAVKNDFFKKMLEEKYAPIIEGALSSIMGREISLVIETMEMGTIEQEPKSNVPTPPQLQTKEPASDQFQSHLNPKYIFENFIVGNSNRMAFAAASRVAEKPAISYNPLFIYGGSGLGKTHLMHAIGNYITKVTKPGAKVLYITSEEFVEAYTKFARGDKEAESLKDYVTSFDVFLMDDIQFLANKVKSQEMFFYIFEKLVNNGKQIVITCDKQPSELEGIEERLVTRFSKGLLVNIKKPDAETCAEILKRKIVNAGIKLENVDPSVITFYAEKFSSDIRTLEGAFTRLIFYVVKFKQANLITMELAIEAVANMVGTEKLDNQLSATRIINVVSDYYNLAPNQLIGKIRTEDIALARHIAMYLIRYNTDLGLKQIGKLFGGRDHTTVMSGVQKVENELKTNMAVKQAVSELEKKLKIK